MGEIKKEGYFIPHCDHESCDLGSFQFTCPNCNNVVVDYDIWWEQDNLYEGKEYKFKCSECEKELILKYDKRNYGFYVK